jgi:hypothetical protein
MGWLQSQVSVAKNLAVVEYASNSTIHFFVYSTSMQKQHKFNLV